MEAFLQPGFWVFVLALAGIYGIFSLGLQYVLVDGFR